MMIAVIGLLVGGGGVLVGAVSVGVTAFWMMRTKMMIPVRSSRTFEETCAAIEETVPKHEGWGFPKPPFDMYEKLAEKGQQPDGVNKIRQYYVCKPTVAKRVLSHSPFISAMMPCTWSVYEHADGTVWISKMNVGLMSKIFPNEVRTAMAEVASAEKTMLAAVL